MQKLEIKDERAEQARRVAGIVMDGWDGAPDAVADTVSAGYVSAEDVREIRRIIEARGYICSTERVCQRLLAECRAEAGAPCASCRTYPAIEVVGGTHALCDGCAEAVRAGASVSDAYAWTDEEEVVE